MTGRLQLLVSALVSTLVGGCSASSSPGNSNRVGADGSVSQGDSGSADSANADVDAGPFCTKPLDPDAGLATLGDVPVAAWCEAAQGRISEWTCQGITSVVIGIGVDCDRQYLFDAGSKQLVAIVDGCNGFYLTRCVSGNPDFRAPTECWNGSVPFSVTDVCAEAGLSNANPDGAGSVCTNNAECPSGFVCGYSTNDPCSSRGACVYGDFNHDPTCSPTTFCACDGTLTRACVGSTGGSALKPVPTLDRTTLCPGG